MKKIFLLMSVFAMVALLSSSLWAEEQKASTWQDEYQAKLAKGMEALAAAKKAGPSGPSGLAYTASEETVLRDALSKTLAADKGGRVCECLKMAVGMEYNPYLVLKTIYGVGGKVEIDQLCTCATESGLTKALMAKAAKEAIGPDNKPIYKTDEVSQAQCFRGLAYQETPVENIPIDPPDPPPVSASAPN